MKIKKAWLIDTSGNITRIPSIEGKEMDFQTMYPLIKCDTIEHVALKKGVDMWVDEEGLLKPNTVNQKASYLCSYDPQIVGNVIVTDNTKAGDYLIEECLVKP